MCHGWEDLHSGHLRAENSIAALPQSLLQMVTGPQQIAIVVLVSRDINGEGVHLLVSILLSLLPSTHRFCVWKRYQTSTVRNYVMGACRLLEWPGKVVNGVGTTPLNG